MDDEGVCDRFFALAFALPLLLAFQPCACSKSVGTATLLLEALITNHCS